MNNKAILAFAILFLLPIKYRTQNKQNTPILRIPPPPSKMKPVTNNELDKIRAIAIAADLGKKTEDIQIEKPYSGSSNTVKVGYVCKSDNTKWNVECKFNLDKKFVA